MGWMQKENEAIKICLEELQTEAEEWNVLEVEVKAPGEVVAYTCWPTAEARHKNARNRSES